MASVGAGSRVRSGTENSSLCVLRRGEISPLRRIEGVKEGLIIWGIKSRRFSGCLLFLKNMQMCPLDLISIARRV